jgi:hypothetical protein
VVGRTIEGGPPDLDRLLQQIADLHPRVLTQRGAIAPPLRSPAGSGPSSRPR